MLNHLIRYKTFYGLTISFILIGLFSLLRFAKGDVVLIFNRNQSEELNMLFMTVTTLGEFIGGTIVFFTLILTSKYKHAFLFLVAVLISSMASQALKRGVFSDEMRPSHMYSQLNPIEDLERHSQYSFPSGHTTAAFTFFSVLAFALKRKRFQVMSFIFAASAGISRVYLGQHFVSDVVAGAVLGSFVAMLVYLILERRLERIPFFEKSLFRS